MLKLMCKYQVWGALLLLRHSGLDKNWITWGNAYWIEDNHGLVDYGCGKCKKIMAKGSFPKGQSGKRWNGVIWSDLKEIKASMDLQSQTKCLEQNREIQWNWKGQGSSDICFCMLFNCFYQSFICERETGYPCYFGIFLTFPNFLRS